MDKVEKISVSLPPKMAANLRKAASKGGYSSASEVVREALRDWADKQERKKEQLAHLRKMIQAGIDSGSAHPFDAGATKRRGRDRLADFKKSA